MLVRPARSLLAAAILWLPSAAFAQDAWTLAQRYFDGSAPA